MISMNSYNCQHNFYATSRDLPNDTSTQDNNMRRLGAHFSGLGSKELIF